MALHDPQPFLVPHFHPKAPQFELILFFGIFSIGFYLLYLVVFVSGKSLQTAKSDVGITFKAKEGVGASWLNWTLFLKG